MTFLKNLISLITIFGSFISLLHSQGNYYPPPSDIYIHNDTLTIFPPDSLPGDPVVLLGYNILVDSVFYDNVMVEDQTDTVDFILDYSTLYPGNRLFCVHAVYNQWISDPECDSAMIIYGFELPFLEDWSSGNFTQNKWKVESGNWTVENDEGNPGPAAVFSGLPAQTNYEIPLESYVFRGDFMEIGRFYLNFDLKLESSTNTGYEKIVIQEWNWAANYWFDRIEFTNQQGSYSWTGQEITLWTMHKRAFKIRFVARGNSSTDIASWSIDNIHISRTCSPAYELEIEESEEYNELSWIPPEIGLYYFDLEWDDGHFSGISIGTGGAVEFDVAARWTPELLNDYDDWPIDKVNFVPTESNAEYTIRIWEGDSVVNLLYEQTVPEAVIGEWNSIALDSTVKIDASQTLWIGYHINTPNGYPAGADDGPAIDGYGNMIYWEDSWQTLLEISPELDYNWNIRAIVGPPPYLPLINFKIYRSINGSAFTYYDHTDILCSYLDTDIYLPDIYCYNVTIEWTFKGDTCESLPTNVACETEMISVKETDEDESIKVFPNPAGDELIIQFDELMERVRIYNLLGEMVFQSDIFDNQYNLDVTGMRSGIYLLEIESGKKIFWKNFIKN
jgi:hypothetical protein